MKGRRRLPLTTPATNTLSAVSSTPSRYTTVSSIEGTRKALIAEEYLTHVGEALQWVEGVLDREFDFGVVEFEQHLRDGVILARMVEALKTSEGRVKIFEVRPLIHVSGVELTRRFPSCRTPSCNGAIRTTSSSSSTGPGRRRSACRPTSSLRRSTAMTGRTCPRSSSASMR